MMERSRIAHRLTRGGALLGALLLIGSAQAQSIVQPGAPGQPSRKITPEQSEALARTKVLPADTAFMRHMIVHHGQAIDMVALIAERTQNRDVRLLGERIAISQNSEIDLMRDWLRRHASAAQPGAEASDPHAHHRMQMAPDLDKAVMPGMLTPRQMQALAAAKGEAFDRLFLTGMIQHHQGAIDMVRELEPLPGAGEEVQLAEFMISVVADQSTEIARMQALLGQAGA